jgi:hypothetical protein
MPIISPLRQNIVPTSCAIADVPGHRQPPVSRAKSRETVPRGLVVGVGIPIFACSGWKYRRGPRCLTWPLPALVPQYIFPTALALPNGPTGPSTYQQHLEPPLTGAGLQCAYAVACLPSLIWLIYYITFCDGPDTSK